MNGYKIAQLHSIPSTLTSKSEEFEGLKPTDCLPSVWSMFLHNAHGTMISGSSFMIDDRFATYRVWFRFIHYNTGKIMEELQFRSQVRVQCGEESAAPANDLEGNICRLIQPLECEDYTIYHWLFLLSSYKTTKVNESARSFGMRISNWT